jgi:hypothetical protein
MNPRWSIMSLVAAGGLTVAVASKSPVSMPPPRPGPATVEQLPLASEARVVYADHLLKISAALAVVVQVRGSWDRDPDTDAYRYTYTLVNDPSSSNTIRDFALAPVPAPLRVDLPSHWDYFYGYEDRDDALLLTVTDAGAAPAGWDSVNVYPSPFDLQPGDSVTFSVVSPLAPAMITYYAQGFNTLPTDGESEGPDPPTIFQNSVTGSVVGPGSTTDVKGPPEGAGIVDLRPPVPNPAGSMVTVAFSVPVASEVFLAVYDISGREVARLAEGRYAPGVHSVTWNGLDANGQRAHSGVYFYRLLVNRKQVGQRKLTILK